jgi:hypothetical protein
MPKSFRLRTKSNTPTPYVNVNVEVGAREGELSDQLKTLKDELKIGLTNEFTKFKEEVIVRGKEK